MLVGTNYNSVREIWSAFKNPNKANPWPNAILKMILLLLSFLFFWTRLNWSFWECCRPHWYLHIQLMEIWGQAENRQKKINNFLKPLNRGELFIRNRSHRWRNLPLWLGTFAAVALKNSRWFQFWSSQIAYEWRHNGWNNNANGRTTLPIKPHETCGAFRKIKKRK